MKYIIRLSLACLALLFCAQFDSHDSSVAGREKPKVYITGTQGGKKIENITIGGRYKRIPVYNKPTKSNVDPKTHTKRLDLVEIKDITLAPTKDDQLPTYSFKKRDYIEIKVTSNNPQKTVNTYLIEQNKKIYFDEINEAGPLENELSIEALTKLTIGGVKEKPAKKESKNDRKSREAA